MANYKTSFHNGRLGIGLDTSENGGNPIQALEINGNIKLTGAILDKDGYNYGEIHEIPTHLLNNGPISYPNINEMEEMFYLEEQNLVMTRDFSGNTGEFDIRRNQKNSNVRGRIKNGIVYNSTNEIKPGELQGEGSIYIQNGSLNINADVSKNIVFQTKYKDDHIVIQDISKNAYGFGTLSINYLTQFDNILSVGGHHACIKIDDHTLILVGENDKGQIGNTLNLNMIRSIQFSSDDSDSDWRNFYRTDDDPKGIMRNLFMDVKSDFSLSGKTEIIKQMECSKKHTILLIDNADTKVIPFFMGDNTFCQSGNLTDLSYNIDNEVYNWSFNSTNTIKKADSTGAVYSILDMANLIPNKDISNVDMIGAGDYHSIMLVNMPTTANQIVFCFGKNTDGQHGNNTFMNSKEKYAAYFDSISPSPDFTYLKLLPEFYSHFYMSKTESTTDISQVKQIVGGGDRTAILFNDGRFYQAGGFQNSFLSDDILDASSNIFLPYLPNVWKNYITNNTPVRNYSSANLYNQQIYLFGGQNESGSDTNELWTLNLNEDKLVWNRILSVNNPDERSQHSMTLHQEKLFLFGGQNNLNNNNNKFNDLWYIELNKDMENYHQWIKLKNNNDPKIDQKYGHSTISYNNKLYVYGGKGNAVFNTMHSMDISGLDPNKEWEEVQVNGEPPQLYNHSADILNNNMYLFGGRNDGVIEQSLITINLNNNEYTTHDTGMKRELHTSQLIDNKLVIFAGQAIDNTPSNAIISIDLSNPITTKIKIDDLDMDNVPQKRKGHIAILDKYDIMYILGGVEGTTSTKQSDVWGININPQKLNDYLDEGEQIMKIDCGKNHTLLITNSGRVFNNQPFPLHITAVADESDIKAVNIKAGDNTSIIQLNTGELVQYYFGNDYEISKAIFDNSNNVFIDICGNLNSTNTEEVQINNAFILNNIDTDKELLTYGLGGIDISSTQFLITIKNGEDNLQKNIKIYSNDLSNSELEFFYKYSDAKINDNRANAFLVESNDVGTGTFNWDKNALFTNTFLNSLQPPTTPDVSDFGDNTSISIGINVPNYDTKNILEISGSMVVGDVSTRSTLENNQLLIKNKLLIGTDGLESMDVAVDVNGIVYSKNGYDTLSDIKFKTNIKQIPNCLEKITKLRGVEYRLKKDDIRKHLGVIAQEVEERIPELVLTGKDDIKSVKYDQMIPLMIECIKTLNKRIEKMNEKVKKLK